MPESTSNPPLSRLPPELRLMIWEAALPDPIVDPLYIWRYDCWKAHRDQTEDAAGENRDTLHIEFDPRPLDCYEIYLPHLFINHEARWVGLRWLEKQQPRLQIRYHKKTRRFSVVRPFDPARDTVYIPYRQWFNFFPNARRIRNLMLKAGVDQQLAHLWPAHRRPGHPLIVKHATPLTRLAFPCGLLHKKSAEHVCPSWRWSGVHPECVEVSIVSNSPEDPLQRFPDIDVVFRTWEVACPKEMKRIIWLPVHDTSRRWHAVDSLVDESLDQLRRAKTRQDRTTAWGGLYRHFKDGPYQGGRFNADLDQIWSVRNTLLNEDTGGQDYQQEVWKRIFSRLPLIIKSVVAVER
ncbi:hypothetical protein BO82DRAFT_402684 [Aspergillus uvarum CBS 121591]|uniref:2EXR domain-containing protein n=1 Tax=Aspergillus uvarum CBS 121591 TaxID=1448315 RepID=A0A319CZL8_9EURO|nr:hypothetical protein BO82DRAFT_402684 [Aspergillus uvarum CBS 121591]PYH81108.1 hypothetical protein BO82DRAFT_402684 [Aspergillus uvarum CBS 121591]